MRDRKAKIFNELDYLTLLLFLLLAGFGLAALFSATYDPESTTSFFALTTKTGKQFLWMSLSLVLGGAILFIHEDVYDVLAYIFYAITLILLIITPLITHGIKGSYSWLAIGPITIQPAEFAKITTALALAKCMSTNNFAFKNWKDTLMAMAIILIPVAIIGFLEREWGTAIVFLVFFVVLYRYGLSEKLFILTFFFITIATLSLLWTTMPFLNANGGSVGLFIGSFITALATGIYLLLNSPDSSGRIVIIATLAYHFILLILAIWVPIPLLLLIAIYQGLMVIFIVLHIFRQWHLKELYLIAFIALALTTITFMPMVLKHLPAHQRNRIELFLKQKEDVAGVGYNTNQSLIAVGAGGFIGRGYLHGTQTTYNYLPEVDTDFIFCTIAEQFGFIGSITVLAIYCLFIVRLFRLAERQRRRNECIFAYCVGCLYTMHVLINISMVLGLIPVIGIPLPLFSYGGSAVMTFTILTFIVLRCDATRTTKLTS